MFKIEKCNFHSPLLQNSTKDKSKVKLFVALFIRSEKLLNLYKISLDWEKKKRKKASGKIKTKESLKY